MKDKERRATGVYAKSGKLYVTVRTYEIVNGQKKYVKKWVNTGYDDIAKNVRKAKDFRENLLLEKDDGYAKESKVTMEEYVKHFLELKKRDIADTTYCCLQYRAKHISEYFREVNIKDIETKDINSFLDHLLRNGNNAIGKNVDAGLSKRSVKDIKALLVSVMSQAQSEGVIRKNPALDATINAQLARKKSYKEEDTFFSYEECKRFLAGAKGHPLYELFYFSIFFGLRRSEALGLKWSNIKFDQRKLVIASTVTKGTTIHRDDTVKTASSLREYPLLDEQIALLEKIKKQEGDNRAVWGKDYFESDYVFKHEDGSLYHPDYPSKAFKKLVMGMPDLPQNIHFHGLRASCVSILVHEGLDVKQIQKWVGHSDVETTLKIYSKVKTEESKNEVANRMNSLIQIM